MFGISPCGKSKSPYGVGLKYDGVHDPTFRSKVSVWLGAPVRRINRQFFAVPMGVTAAFATVSIGRDGSKKYPLNAVAMCRKNMRRPMCGNRQNCVPVICFQSNPNLSLMILSASITEHKIELVDTHPSQVFDH